MSSQYEQYISNLPEELHQNIISFLSVDDIKSLSLTSHLIYERCSNPLFWIKKTVNDFGIPKEIFSLSNTNPIVRYIQMKYYFNKSVLPINDILNHKLQLGYFAGYLGDINLIYYCHRHYIFNYDSLEIGQYFNRSIDGCLSGKNYNIIPFLMIYSPTYWDDTDIVSLLKILIKQDNIESVKYIFNNYPYCDNNKIYCMMISSCINTACEEGNLNIILYLTSSTESPTRNNNNNIHHLFSTYHITFKDIESQLIKLKHINILKYLIENLYLDIEGCLNTCVSHDSVDIISDLISLSIKLKNFDNINWKFILQQVIIKDRYKILKYFLDNSVYNFGMHDLNDILIMMTSCTNASYDCLEILLSPVNINSFTLDGIIGSCINYKLTSYSTLHKIIHYAIENNIIKCPRDLDPIIKNNTSNVNPNVKEYIINIQKMLSSNPFDKSRYKFYLMKDKISKKAVHSTEAIKEGVSGIAFATYLLINGYHFTKF